MHKHCPRVHYTDFLLSICCFKNTREHLFTPLDAISISVAADHSNEPDSVVQNQKHLVLQLGDFMGISLNTALLPSTRLIPKSCIVNKKCTSQQ